MRELLRVSASLSRRFDVKDRTVLFSYKRERQIRSAQVRASRRCWGRGGATNNLSIIAQVREQYTFLKREDPDESV